MKLALMLLGGVCLFFPGSTWASVPVGSALANIVENPALDSELATPKSLGSSLDAQDGTSGPRFESKSKTWKAVKDLDPEEATPRVRSPLIEKGHAQAKAAAAAQFRRGLRWAGGILAGLGLLAGGGAYVWWRRSRRSRSRANPTARLLMFPMAYSVPPEPPVPNAVPQPEPGASQEIRPAA